MANMHLVTGYAGEAHITSADQGSFNAAIVGGESYVMERGGKLSATVVSNNKITISDGDLVMQGRHARLSGTCDLSIANGAQGKLRNDLIVARYKKDAGTSVETVDLVVVQGTPSDSSPVDPETNTGDIFNGASIADYPLYRVPISGINVQTPVQLFNTVRPLADQKRIVVGDVDPAYAADLNVGDIYIWLQG